MVQRTTEADALIFNTAIKCHEHGATYVARWPVLFFVKQLNPAAFSTFSKPERCIAAGGLAKLSLAEHRCQRGVD